MKFIKKISKETGNTESNNITKIFKGQCYINNTYNYWFVSIFGNTCKYRNW